LCEGVYGTDRKTNYNAFAIINDDIYVPVKSTFANTIFSKVLVKDLPKKFKILGLIQGSTITDEREADFLN